MLTGDHRSGRREDDRSPLDGRALVDGSVGDVDGGSGEGSGGGGGNDVCERPRTSEQTARRRKRKGDERLTGRKTVHVHLSVSNCDQGKMGRRSVRNETRNSKKGRRVRDGPLLNQVQAKLQTNELKRWVSLSLEKREESREEACKRRSATHITPSAAGASAGISTSNWSVSRLHPPMIDRMTWKLVPLSYEREYWQAGKARRERNEETKIS